MTEQMTLERVRDALREDATSWRFDAKDPHRAQFYDQLANAIDAHLNAAKCEAVVVFEYAYRYPDGIRTGTGGREINGCKPTEVIPLYTHPASPDVMRDAERYRWLRKHSVFANDSMHELWFDASLDRGETEQLDKQIDDAMAAREGGK